MKITKKILILLCLFLFTIQPGKGQRVDISKSSSQKGMTDIYMQRRKTNNIIGLIMLGSGIGMTIGGLAINVSTGWGEGNKNNGLYLSYFGGFTTIASIPLFISAASNKRKAKLLLRGEFIPIMNELLTKSNCPALDFVIQF